MVRLGIFGGTFNPIHYGHLALAEAAREQLKLDRVVFIPTARPPHKRRRHLLEGKQRLKLIELAIRDNHSFVVSDLELARGGTSYSIDTVRILRKQFPLAALFLLVGQDMLSVRWIAWKELKELCVIAVAQRPGAPAFRSESKIRRIAIPQLEISSSDLRARLSAGGSIRYLVPPQVERRIRERQLYKKEKS